MTDQEKIRINREGKALEQAGRISEAIALYESGIARGTDTPYTFTRLRVLYRKLKRSADVERIEALMKAEFGHTW